MGVKLPYPTVRQPVLWAGGALMLLEFRNIEKSFAEKAVLKGISFSVGSGKAFGLLGRNGAGKTSSIRILMNVFPADGGEILIDGAPIRYDRVSFGYLPEERGLYPKKTVIDQLSYFAELKGMKHRAAVQAIDAWLARLDMSQYRNKRLDTLSKGNQQKIQLITALVHEPQIIILDEPFSGLDPVNAMLLKSVVNEEIAAGKIVLFSSHQMSYIEEFCDSIAIIKDGKVVLNGELHEIKRNYPRDRLVISTADAAQLKRDFGAACSEMEQGGLMLRLAEPAEKQTVMRQLVERYDIDELSVYEPSLNDIFVEYTAGGTEEERR